MRDKKYIGLLFYILIQCLHMALEATPEHAHENKEEIIENLFLFLKEAREKEENSEERKFPKVLEQLPKDLREIVSLNFQRFKSYGLTEQQLLAELSHDVETMKMAYEDKRFEIPNGSYLRYEIKHLIDNLVASFSDTNINLTKIRGLGVINLDVNGLKTVNDIIGHDAGTEYLRRVVSVFTNGTTTKELEAKGINVFVSSNGGDEFVIILSDDVNLTEKIDGQTFINQTLKKYQDEVNAVPTKDLADFNKPAIAAKFKGIEIPKDFVFTASVSGGTAHIEEVLVDDGFSPNARMGYSENLNHMISSLFELSDKRSKENKNAFKAELEESTDSHKKFLAILLKRNLDTAMIEEENKKLKELIEKLQSKK